MRSKPEMIEDALGWYDAFQQLTHSRPSGFSGALPIPLTELEAYCRIMDLPIEDRPDFVRVLRRVDLGYLALLDKRKTVTLTQPDKGA